MTKVVNFYAGPGSGKSTMTAGVFYYLKSRGVNCEMALEYAKDKVWEESFAVLENQIYVFGKQLHRIWRLIDKVDVILTDSPLLVSLVYGSKESEEFHALVRQTYNRFDNKNYFLTRVKNFEPAGRMQTEEKAKVLDNSMLDMLKCEGVDYEIKPAHFQSAERIAKDIISGIGVSG